MKTLILLSILFTQIAFAKNNPTVILTPNGSLKIKNPFVRESNKEELEGKGHEFFGRAKVQDGKVSVWIRGCKDVQLGDLNNNEDKEQVEKLQKIRNNDNIRLKMSGFGKCEVAGWEKN